jgi:hypothetical protein
MASTILFSSSVSRDIRSMHISLHTALRSQSISFAMQRKNAENLKQIFPE